MTAIVHRDVFRAGAWVRRLAMLTIASVCWLGFGVASPGQDLEADFNRNARRAAPRDAFPVFNNPKMVPANRAAGLADREWVIGVAIGNEAKAYPIAVMGVHELGNDTCGGKPIAVSW